MSQQAHEEIISKASSTTDSIAAFMKALRHPERSFDDVLVLLDYSQSILAELSISGYIGLIEVLVKTHYRDNYAWGTVKGGIRIIASKLGHDSIDCRQDNLARFFHYTLDDENQELQCVLLKSRQVYIDNRDELALYSLLNRLATALDEEKGDAATTASVLAKHIRRQASFRVATKRAAIEAQCQVLIKTQASMTHELTGLRSELSRLQDAIKVSKVALAKAGKEQKSAKGLLQQQREQIAGLQQQQVALQKTVKTREEKVRVLNDALNALRSDIHTLKQLTMAQREALAKAIQDKKNAMDATEQAMHHVKKLEEKSCELNKRLMVMIHDIACGQKVYAQYFTRIKAASKVIEQETLGLQASIKKRLKELKKRSQHQQGEGFLELLHAICQLQSDLVALENIDKANRAIRAVIKSQIQRKSIGDKACQAIERLSDRVEAGANIIATLLSEAQQWMTETMQNIPELPGLTDSDKALVVELLQGSVMPHRKVFASIEKTLSTQRATIQSLEVENSAVNAQLATLNQSLAVLSAQNKQLNRRLIKTEQYHAALSKQLGKGDVLIARAKAHIAEIDRSIATLEEALAKLSAQLSEWVGLNTQPKDDFLLKQLLCLYETRPAWAESLLHGAVSHVTSTHLDKWLANHFLFAEKGAQKASRMQSMINSPVTSREELAKRFRQLLRISRQSRSWWDRDSLRKQTDSSKCLTSYFCQQLHQYAVVLPQLLAEQQYALQCQKETLMNERQWQLTWVHHQQNAKRTHRVLVK